MKTTKRWFALMLAAFLIPAIQTFGIEGLKLTVEQGTNIVLSWPSLTNETYVVQYRPSLNTNDTWQTLTNYFPAESGTNLTTFIHTNAACPGSGSGGGGGSTNDPPDPGGFAGGFWEPQLPPVPWDTNTWGGGEYSYSSFGGGIETTNQACQGFYRVVRNGIHVVGLTNGMILSGRTNFPIEIGEPENSPYAGATFYVNGIPLHGAEVDTNILGMPELTWDTTYMTNGSYTIYVEADFEAGELITNQSVTVTVTNAIMFPVPFSTVYGAQMWVYAELADQVADWEIKMYDDNNNYIGSFIDSTTDGTISFLWDLTDGGSYTFTDTNFTADFIVTTSVAGSGGGGSSTTNSSKRKWIKEQYWNSDDFVIAWGALNNNSTTSEKINNMVAWGTVETIGAVHNINPGNQVGAYQAFEFNASSGSAFVSYLKDSSYRNLYFFGHGSATRFGGVTASITESQIRRQLVNFWTYAGRFEHPYRFVFIDGCVAGKGSMCEAFGIPNWTTDVNAFVNLHGVHPRCFVSFLGSTGFNQNNWPGEAQTLARFWSDWMAEKTITQCLEEAEAESTEPFEEDWIVKGAYDMTRSARWQ